MTLAWIKIHFSLYQNKNLREFSCKTHYQNREEYNVSNRYISKIMCFFKKKNQYIKAFELIDKNNISSLRKKVKILIVDDENDDLYVMLRERQYNVYYKKDMTYSIEAEPFDIALIDIKGIAQRRKSSMEGFDLACEIKKAYPLKKICCFSGSIHKEISSELANNKIDAFFMKDLENDKIAEKIDELIKDFSDYHKQWDVIYNQLRANSVADDQIAKIEKAYNKSFETGEFSGINSILNEHLKNASTVINIISSVLTLAKVLVV